MSITSFTFHSPTAIRLSFPNEQAMLVFETPAEGMWCYIHGLTMDQLEKLRDDINDCIKANVAMEAGR